MTDWRVFLPLRSRARRLSRNKLPPRDTAARSQAAETKRHSRSTAARRGAVASYARRLRGFNLPFGRSFTIPTPGDTTWGSLLIPQQLMTPVSAGVFFVMTKYRHLYNTAKWRGSMDSKGKRHGGLAKLAIARAGAVCAKCGTICLGQAGEPNSPIADHIIPHRGDRVLFFDPDNLQCLCLDHHTEKTNLIERYGYSNDLGDDGYPLDPMHPMNRVPA